MNSRKIKKEGGGRKGVEGVGGEGEGGHYPIKPSPLIINKNNMNKIDYDPVIKTGVLSSSIYDDGNVIKLGEKTHLALVEGSEHKFAAFEVVSATNKDGSPCLLQEQDCEDGKFAVLSISALKAKRVYNSDQLTSNRRLSTGMSISEILALEPGVEYRLSRKDDGYKKPYGWQEGDPLSLNHSYRLEAVATPKTESKPTPKTEVKPTAKK